MPVAKVIEITSTSTKSFEDAIEKGIAQADKTLHNIEGAWIQKVEVTNGKIDAYRVNMLVTFILDDKTNQLVPRDEAAAEQLAPRISLGPHNHASFGTASLRGLRQ